jgi:hypothetical protein
MEMARPAKKSIRIKHHGLCSPWLGRGGQYYVCVWMNSRVLIRYHRINRVLISFLSPLLSLSLTFQNRTKLAIPLGHWKLRGAVFEYSFHH